jgi:hypothetical protein
MAEEQRGFFSRLFGGRDDAPEEMPTDFFSLPMGANPKKDRVVGMDESGLPQYESPLGVRYIIRPTMPEGFETEAGTLARVAEVGRDAIEGTIDGVVSGFTAPARALRGEPVTYGDALATAGTASLGGAASPVPEGSLRSGYAPDRTTAPFDAGRASYIPNREITLKDAYEARAEQMALAPNDRVQPRADREGFVDADYETPPSLPIFEEDLSARYPRNPDPNASLPLRDRSRVLVERRDEIADALAERIRNSGQLGSNTQYFYHSDGPLFRAAVRAGLSEEEAAQYLRDFSQSYAATSPRTNTTQNLLNATSVMAKNAQGIPFREIVGPGSGGINESGYPMMSGPTGIHGKLLDRYAAEGELDWDTNPKPATFGQNVVGNRSGATMDTHAIRGVLMTLNQMEPGGVPEGFILPSAREAYRQDPTRLTPSMIDDTLGSQMVDGRSMQTEYPVFADIMHAAAERLGVSPAEAQSMAWFGFGDETNLGSAANTVSELFDQRLDVTAEVLGIPTEEAARLVFTRQIPLLANRDATVGAAALMAPEDDEQEDIPQFNRGGLVLSDATKGIRTREGMEMANKKFQLDRSKADQDGDGDVSKLEEVQGEAAQRTVGKDDLVEMNCGGIMMPDMELDPVSGNEVPLGSTPENVRDDIPAMLSQDEYVLPAHVVKWHGLKHIQEMQMEAEAGLMSMSMEGLIGGVEEAAEEADEDDTMEDEYVMDVEVDVPTVEVEDELEGEEYEEEPQTSTLPGMMKKQKYAFIIS